MVKMKPEEKIGKGKARKTVSEHERHISEDEKRTSWTRTGGEKKE